MTDKFLLTLLVIMNAGMFEWKFHIKMIAILINVPSQQIYDAHTISRFSLLQDGHGTSSVVMVGYLCYNINQA